MCVWGWSDTCIQHVHVGWAFCSGVGQSLWQDGSAEGAEETLFHQWHQGELAHTLSRQCFQTWYLLVKPGMLVAIYIQSYMTICTYMYMYIEDTKVHKRKKERKNATCAATSVHVHVCTYMYTMQYCFVDVHVVAIFVLKTVVVVSTARSIPAHVVRLPGTVLSPAQSLPPGHRGQ